MIFSLRGVLNVCHNCSIQSLVNLTVFALLITNSLNRFEIDIIDPKVASRTMYSYIADLAHNLLFSPLYAALSLDKQRVAQQHFGCASLDGVELENQGGAGTSAAHFEKRIVLVRKLLGKNVTDLRSSRDDF